MSKGTPMRTFRLHDEAYRLIMHVIEHRNEHSEDSPWTFSDFIFAAIREKIDKMARSRGHHILPPCNTEIEEEADDYYTPAKDGLGALADDGASA